MTGQRINNTVQIALRLADTLNVLADPHVNQLLLRMDDRDPVAKAQARDTGPQAMWHQEPLSHRI